MMPKIATSLKEKVEGKLRQNAQTKELPIEVIDSNGVIILQGEVPSEGTSMIAEGLVRQVEGVVNVVNELAVNKHDSKKSVIPPGHNLSQTR